MPIAQPLSTDPLSAPDHSALHRIIAADPAGPAKTIQVDAAGVSYIGDPALVNYARFAADGELNLYGTARIINSEWIDAAGIHAPGAKPATQVIIGVMEIPTWSFNNEEAAGNQQTVSFKVRATNRMDRSLPLTMKLKWACDTNAGNIVWQLECTWRKLNEDTAPAATQTLPFTTAVSGTVRGLVETQITGIALPDADDILLFCRLMRLSADAADNVADSIELFGITVSWTTNKLGTAT